MNSSTDIFGVALWDHYQGTAIQDIIVHSSIAHDDVMPLPYLFRNFQEMPFIEQKALQLTTGKTLDVGSGAGSHSLWLQDKNIKVTGIDISEGAVTLSRKRGLKDAQHCHLLRHTALYDTILLLMNGTGIFESLQKIDRYLQHLKSMLVDGGQILIDGSDIRYMFENEDGSYWRDLQQEYYGEVQLAMSYNGVRSPAFNWLYLDFETLRGYAKKNELNCELIIEGSHYDYLARLSSPV